jgi:hypothetical protein
MKIWRTKCVFGNHPSRWKDTTIIYNVLFHKKMLFFSNIREREREVSIHEITSSNARNGGRTRQHSKYRWILLKTIIIINNNNNTDVQYQMIFGNAVDRDKLCQIVFVRRIIAVPCNNIERRMIHFRFKQRSYIHNNSNDGYCSPQHLQRKKTSEFELFCKLC